jgi:uncharacterized protein (TIGR01777 family)
MIAAISGASGFIGRSLVVRLKQEDHSVRILERAHFQPENRKILDDLIDGCDLVINLAGAPVSKKWTPEWKQEILRSRIEPTRMIAGAIESSTRKPSLFISASAIGIYSSDGSHTEESKGFSGSWLAEVCRQWEQAAHVSGSSTRTVIFRTGVVLGKNGGALEKLEKIFSLGLGGKLGSGGQSFSFIHLHDLISAFIFVINNDQISGVVNAVSPYPSTNREFTEKLGRVFGQPAFFRVPAFALKLAYGEGAQVLLEGQRVLPDKLLKAGFRFQFPTIQNALLDIFS